MTRALRNMPRYPHIGREDYGLAFDVLSYGKVEQVYLEDQGTSLEMAQA